MDHVGKNENGEIVWKIESEESSESISSDEAVGIGYRPANWYYVGYWNQAFSSVKDREIISENEAFYAQQALTERAWLQSEAKRAALERLPEGQRIVEGIDFNPCYEFRLLERNPGLENVYPEFYIISGAKSLGPKVLSKPAKSLLKRNATKAAPQYTKSSLKMGQEMHKAYKVGEEGFKEFRLPSGKHIDFLDINNSTIYELKPFNPRGIQMGTKQLNIYMQELQTMPRFQGYKWETVLDFY